MNTGDWLAENTKKLSDAGIGTARLDCLVLLEDATGKDRAYLLAHLKITAKGSTFRKLDEQVKRRAGHEPLAYIRGKSEFYAREFIVNKHVLEPRPESETMVELLKELVTSHQSPVTRKNVSGDNKRQETSDHNLLIVDVGTGCGALGITAKLEFPDIEVILTDIDPNCLKVARQNAKKHKVNVTFLQGNLLEPLLHSQPGFTYVEPGDVFSLSSEIKRMDDTLHEQRKGKIFTGPRANSRVASFARKQAVGDTWILLANLPYVPDSHTINQAAMQEPKIAIFGGPDGLDLYRQLFSQLSENKQFISVKYVLTESLPPQHPALAKIAKNHCYIQYQEDDFIQIFVKK